MIILEKAKKEEKKEVYDWVTFVKKEEEKKYRHSNFDLFFKPVEKMNQEMVYETLENSKYENIYHYYFAKEEDKIIGFLCFVHRTRNHHNDIRVISLFAKDQKEGVYDVFLDLLTKEAKENHTGRIDMCVVFPEEKVFQKSLENHSFLLKKISFTITDLMVERKRTLFGYKISFLGEGEISEVKKYFPDFYYDSNASFVLIAKKKKRIVGVLSGSIASPYYTLADLDVLLADSEKIKHDLLNEFKRICLKEGCDDILAETKSFKDQEFFKKEGFLESRRAYYFI